MFFWKVGQQICLVASKKTGEVVMAWALAIGICFLPNIKRDSTWSYSGLKHLNVAVLFHQIIDKDICYSKEKVQLIQYNMDQFYF